MQTDKETSKKFEINITRVNTYPLDIASHNEYKDYLANLNQEQNIWMRKIYAPVLLGIGGLWLLGVLTIIFLSGYHWKSFSLSDAVLITLLTSTTANILGIWVILFKYIFPTLTDT